MATMQQLDCATMHVVHGFSKQPCCGEPMVPHSQATPCKASHTYHSHQPCVLDPPEYWLTYEPWQLGPGPLLRQSVTGKGRHTATLVFPYAVMSLSLRQL